MSTAEQMLSTHPRPSEVNRDLVADAVDALYACAQACSACADACLGESDPAALAKCIRLNLDCADQCVAAGRVLSRQTEVDVTVLRAVVEACAQACKACGDECARHADHHEHCRVCADACRRCEQACRKVVDAIAS